MYEQLLYEEDYDNDHDIGVTNEGIYRDGIYIPIGYYTEQINEEMMFGQDNSALVNEIIDRLHIVANARGVPEDGKMQVQFLHDVYGEGRSYTSTKRMPIDELTFGVIDDLITEITETYNGDIIVQYRIIYPLQHGEMFGCKDRKEKKYSSERMKDLLKHKCVLNHEQTFADTNNINDNYCLDRCFIIWEKLREASVKKTEFKLNDEGEEKKRLASVKSSTSKTLKTIRDSDRGKYINAIKKVRRELEFDLDEKLSLEQAILMAEYYEMDLCHVKYVEEKREYKVTQMNECKDGKGRIYILFDDEHAILIKDINKLDSEKKTYCKYCNKWIRNHTIHKGCRSCTMCGRNNCPSLVNDSHTREDTEVCNACGLGYNDNEDEDGKVPSCFAFHIYDPTRKKRSLCDIYGLCQGCNRRVSKDNHDCGTKFCDVCRIPQPFDHFMFDEKDGKVKPIACWIQRPEDRKIIETKYAYMDAECSQTRLVTSKKKKRGANDKDAYYHDLELVCFEDDRGRSFEFTDMNKCVEHILTKYKKYTIMAHNGGKYDYTILKRYIDKYLIETDSKLLVEDIARPCSTAMLKMEIKKSRLARTDKITFKDSINWLGMSLSTLSRSLGLDEKAYKKFDFPIFAIGTDFMKSNKIPPKKYFTYSTRTSDGFDAWYNNKKKEKWNGKKELAEYCRQDVKILKKVCEVFKDAMKEVIGGGYDPFAGKNMTIASMCMDIYRRKFMKPNTIPIIQKSINNELRKCMYGGRVQCFRTYWRKMKLSQKIMHYDVVSEYPYVMYNKPYPACHPELFTNEDFNMTKSSDEAMLDIIRRPGTLSVVWCDVEPPRGMLHYVIPHKDANGRLVFDATLKYGIAVTSVEMLVAESMGYKFSNLSKMYYWSKTSNDLFKDYVGTFFRIKIENSKLPNNISILKKQGKIDEYESAKLKYEKEITRYYGFKILAKVREDPSDAMRTLAKTCLVNLWGKFGQKENVSKSFVIDDDEKGYARFFNETKKLKDWEVAPINTNPIQFKIDYNSEDVKMNYGDDKSSQMTNMPIAIFTTAYGRLKLWEEMSKLHPEQLLYCDTDSIIYLRDSEIDKHKDLKEGDMLGEMSQQEYVKGVTTDIIEVLICGKKCYAVKVRMPNGSIKTFIKVKGHNMKSEEAKNTIRYNLMKAMCIAKNDIIGQDQVEIKTERSIKRRRVEDIDKKLKMQVITIPEKKIFRCTIDGNNVDEESRIVIPNGSNYNIIYRFPEMSEHIKMARSTSVLIDCVITRDISLMISDYLDY